MKVHLERRYRAWFLVFVLFLGGSLGFWGWRQHQAAVSPSLALRELEKRYWPSFSDDLSRESLKKALDRNLAFLAARPPAATVAYGRTRYAWGEIFAAQQRLRRFLDQSSGSAELARYLRENFVVYEAGGNYTQRKKILVTGYYVPLLSGSRQPDNRYRYPLYRPPADLVRVSLAEYHLADRWRRRSRFWRWFLRLVGDPEFPPLVGRLTASRQVVPYYTRKEIDEQGVLAGKKLEIIWLDDPVERFFLHIQGSGQVMLPGGGMVTVGYAAANGQPYRSIGSWLIRHGYLQREDVTMPAIRTFLRQHPQLQSRVFNSNPSYVFFRFLEGGEVLGCWAIPLTAGRSIATDRRLFPGAALAYLASEKPVFNPDGSVASWLPFGRLVFNQDTGGAIRGSRRVDLFCGAGEEAEKMAGVMKQPGRLFFLAPKKEPPTQ